MFGNSQLMGIDMGFPDVCLTPAPPSPSPVPVPYPNVCLGPTYLGFVPNVLYMGTPAHNLASTAPMSNGDNLGLALGVASGTVMGPGRHLTGAFTVLVGGLPASRVSSASLQNSTNCPGARTVPSQLKVLILAP